MSRHLGLTSLALVAINVLVAATGYLREFVLARTFGAGAEMDAFYFSLALVQATHDLLFGAALTATIVPLLHSPDHRHAGSAADPARFTVSVALIVGLAACVVAIAVRAALPYLIDVLAPSMSADARARCIALGSVLVWLLPLNALTNVGILVLNAHQRFILAALAYFLINVAFIAALLLLAPIIGSSSLAFASLAGPLLVVPILAASLARIGLLRLLRPDFSRKFLVPLWRQSRPILLTLGIGSSIGLLMVAHLIIRGFAADRGPGSIAALGYAFRLYELPLSLLANPAAVLMLPTVAILYKTGRTVEIGATSRQMLLAGLVVLFPAAFVTWASADLIVRVLLERGNFGNAAALLTADALRGFAPAIVVEGVIVVFYRVFYAIHRPSRAVLASCAALLTLLALLPLYGNLAFIAVPLSLSAGFLVGAAVLVGFLIADVGVGAVPRLSALAKWAVCALIGVLTWKVASRYATGNVWAELLTASAFMLAYGAAVLIAFADYRLIVAGLCRAFALRLARLVGWS